MNEHKHTKSRMRQRRGRLSHGVNPRAQANRLRVQLLSGMAVQLGATESDVPKPLPPCCPRCDRPMQLLRRLQPAGRSRAPPALLTRLRPVRLQRTV